MMRKIINITFSAILLVLNTAHKPGCQENNRNSISKTVSGIQWCSVYQYADVFILENSNISEFSNLNRLKTEFEFRAHLRAVMSF